jgi:hypothetical protein
MKPEILIALSYVLLSLFLPLNFEEIYHHQQEMQ